MTWIGLWLVCIKGISGVQVNWGHDDQERLHAGHSAGGCLLEIPDPELASLYSGRITSLHYAHAETPFTFVLVTLRPAHPGESGGVAYRLNDKSGVIRSRRPGNNTHRIGGMRVARGDVVGFVSCSDRRLTFDAKRDCDVDKTVRVRTLTRRAVGTLSHCAEIRTALSTDSPLCRAYSYYLTVDVAADGGNVSTEWWDDCVATTEEPTVQSFDWLPVYVGVPLAAAFLFVVLLSSVMSIKSIPKTAGTSYFLKSNKIASQPSVTGANSNTWSFNFYGYDLK